MKQYESEGYIHNIKSQNGMSKSSHPEKLAKEILIVEKMD